MYGYAWPWRLPTRADRDLLGATATYAYADLSPLPTAGARRWLLCRTSSQRRDGKLPHEAWGVCSLVLRSMLVQPSQILRGACSLCTHRMHEAHTHSAQPTYAWASVSTYAWAKVSSREIGPRPQTPQDAHMCMGHTTPTCAWVHGAHMCMGRSEPMCTWVKLSSRSTNRRNKEGAHRSP